MDFNPTQAFHAIGNAAQGVLEGIGQGVNSAANAIGNVVGSWGKGLNDEWQTVQQALPQKPQDIGTYLNPQTNTGQQPNFWTTPVAQSLGQVQQRAQSGQLPDDVQNSLINMTNQITRTMSPGPTSLMTQAAGRGAAGIAKGLTRLATTSQVKESPFEHAGDIASGIGAAFMPGQSVAMGAVNVPYSVALTAGQSFLHGQMPQMPTIQDIQNTYQQGIQYGTQFAPIAAAAGVPLQPLLSKISPAGVTGLKGLAQRMAAGGISGAVGMGTVGALQPAASPQERLQNTLQQAGQGTIFGTAGQLLSKPSLPALSEQYAMGKSQTVPDQVFTSGNGMKYTGRALDAYEKLVPSIARQQQEFSLDPDGAMAKMLPQDTYTAWYKAQSMNHSEGGNAVLKDARGYFGYISPQDVPAHAQDATNVMDHFVFNQLTENNGYPSLAVVRQTYDTNGNPNPLQITDGHHRFPVGKDIGMEKIPAVILDDSQPLLRDQFNHMKGIKDMTIGQMQPTQQGLVRPYSGGAEANLAYLNQPGTGKTIGEMQMEHQRAEGLGALADFDEGVQTNNTDKATAALNQILNAPTDSPLAIYKNTFLAAGKQEGLIPADASSNIDLAKAFAKAKFVGGEALNPQESEAVHLSYLQRISDLAGQDPNVRNLKTPQGQVPSDMGDQENMLGIVGRENVPTTPMPFDQTRATQQDPYLESQFVSNNQGQMNLNQASAALTTPQHQALLDSLNQIHQDVQVPVLNTQSLVGDTKTYGSENSVRQDFMADDTTGRLIAAQKGLAGNQLSTLRFQYNAGGPDTLVEFNMPRNLTLPQIANIMNKEGLEFRSFDPKTNGVVIVDQGSSNLDSVNNLLDKYDIATAKQFKGTAEFVGDTSENPTRQNAAQIYNQIIQNGGRNPREIGYGNADNRLQQPGEINQTPQVMAEQGNVLAGMKILNQVRPLPEVPSADDISDKQLALNQIKAGIPTPKGKLPDLGMQQLNQLRLQQNPDFYGTQANAPTDGSARPPVELSQALTMKSSVQDNLTNAKLLQDNYDQYRIQARQQGETPATKAQLNQYVKTLQKNANTLDDRIKTLQPDNPLLQNQIQAGQDAPQAMQIAQDAAAQNGAHVSARIKSVESQAGQMDRKEKTSTQINDSLGFRVVAPTQAQADAVLEQIKTSPRVKVVKQEQVSDPKTGYIANHLDVKIGDSPQTIEYQGMTQDMAKLSQDTHEQYKVLDNPPTRVQLRQLTQLGYQPDQLSKISQDDAKGIIADKIPPTDHPITNEPVSATIPQVPGSATLDDAVSARFGTTQNIEQRSQNLMPLITDAVRTPVETEAFRQAVEHPDRIGTLAQQAHDPNKFINAVNQFNQFNDYVYKTAEQSGLGMGYVKDYYSHILDLSDPAMQAKFNDLMQQRATNYKGYFTKSRIFANIDDLRQLGFQLKNPNVPLDLQEYSRAAQLAVGNSAFLQKLSAYKPEDVKPISKAGVPVDAQGRAFVQSQIPGLSDTAFSQDLNNELHQKIGNSLEPGTLEGIAKYYDKANKFMKQIELSGGGFHILNTAPNYVADQLMSGHFPGVLKAAQVFFDPRAMHAYRQQAITDGTLDKASAMNVTLSKAADISTDSLGNIDTGKTLNPVKLLNQGIFGRLMDYFKLETVRNANVDLSTPKGIADARDIGAQINNLFGGQNRAVGDSIFKSKGAQAAARAVFLAPDYQEGRVGNTLSAIKSPFTRSPGDIYAAKQLFGRILVTAGIAEAARRLVTGGFDSNVKDIFQHAFLDPQTPLPFNSNPTAKAPLGNPLIGRFPTSEPADMYRAANDPVHFLLSHLGALPSTIISGLTGKDYYGQDLVDPYAPKQEGLAGVASEAGAIAQSKLPIPGVQLAKLMQGKVNIPTALTNTLGIRVAQNPNNPGVAYETSRAAIEKDMTPVQKAAFEGINMQKTNPYTGQPIASETTQQKLTDTPAKSLYLYNHFDAPYNTQHFQEIIDRQTAAKTGEQVDPIYDLTPAQQKTVLLMRSYLPGQNTSSKTATIAANKDWYPAFQQKENAYFSSLNLDKQLSLIPNTLASPSTQKLLDQYFALPTGTGQRTAFSTAHPEIGDYFNAYNLAKTQEQMDLGLVPAASATTGGGSRSSSNSSSSSYDQQYLDRALLRNMLLYNIPTPQEQKVPSLFLEPGQQATSRGILNILPQAAPKKPVTAIRFGGNTAPTYSRMTVQYKRPRFVQNIKGLGGVS